MPRPAGRRGDTVSFGGHDASLRTTTPARGGRPGAAPRRAPGLRYRYPGARADALAGLDLDGRRGRVRRRRRRQRVGQVHARAPARRPGEGRPGRRGRSPAATTSSTDDGRMAARRDVGVLFQNPENQLVAECVEDDVAFGLENLGWAPEEIRARVDEMLERFGLDGAPAPRAAPALRRPEAAHGARRRARRAAARPRARRADGDARPGRPRRGAARPCASLRDEGLAVVYVTQEMDEVVGADRVVALEAGSSCTRATSPASSATRARAAARPRAAGRRRARARAGRARARAHRRCRSPWTRCSPPWARMTDAAQSPDAAPERAWRWPGLPRRRLQLRGGARADPGAARRRASSSAPAGRWRCSARPARASRRCCR